MTFHAPWEQASYKKKRKATKKKANKKAKRKVAKKAKKAPARKKTKKKRAARRGRRARDRVVVSKADLNKIRKSVARPKWVDQLPESKRKVFKYKGKSYWPLYSLLYVVDAVEVVPLSQWDGPTNKNEQGALLRPGFVKTIGRKKYVYVEHAQFIQRGSPLDV